MHFNNINRISTKFTEHNVKLHVMGISNVFSDLMNTLERDVLTVKPTFISNFGY